MDVSVVLIKCLSYGLRSAFPSLAAHVYRTRHRKCDLSIRSDHMVSLQVRVGGNLDVDLIPGGDCILALGSLFKLPHQFLLAELEAGISGATSILCIGRGEAKAGQANQPKTR